MEESVREERFDGITVGSIHSTVIQVLKWGMSPIVNRAEVWKMKSQLQRLWNHGLRYHALGCSRDKVTCWEQDIL